MVCTIAIVIGFGIVEQAAAAYGMGVAMAMIITTILLHVVMTERWKWPAPLAYSVTAVFVTIDIAFFGANLLKTAAGRLGELVHRAAAVHADDDVEDRTAAGGGAADGAGVSARGLRRGDRRDTTDARARHGGLHDRAAARHAAGARPQPSLQQDPARARRRAHRDDGAGAVRGAEGSGSACESLGYGIYNVRVQYGFMQDPNVPEALGMARDQGIELDPADMIYFLGRETIIVTQRAGMAMWREKLFVLMARNAVRATAFFRLPPERVVELGVQVEM